ncbi:DUF378 domain-containing protein [Candidatus Dependentiae bacterium]|nr:DUF378 domain-containing protein [Candidatus Dependentiae bacterium]
MASTVNDTTKIVHLVALALTIIGALNWGLVGAFDFNLVEQLLGAYPMLKNGVYILVGLSALVLAATHFANCKLCSSYTNSSRSE